MSVGIMDADMAEYTLVPFNLEVMKLSAYYKRKNEIVILAPKFTPERHQKFFYVKDYEDGKYPPNLLTTPNVQYTGLAFSNNNYQPLDIAIEKMRPDTSIYAKMADFIKGDAYRDKIYQNMMTAEHCRLSLDSKTVWSDYGRQFKNLKQCRNIMFHDYDLGAIEGGYEEVKAILARARTDGWATRVGMKFPVQVKTGQDLLNWSSLRCNSTFYSIRYIGVVDDDSFSQWVGSCKERAIYAQLEYYVTAPWYEENDFIFNLLPRIFRQVIVSRSYRVHFSLKYDEGFFTDSRWGEVLQLFNYFLTSYTQQPTARYLKKIGDDTLYDFAAGSWKNPSTRYGEKAFGTDKIRELFAFVREQNYDLFVLFYECTANQLGGKL